MALARFWHRYRPSPAPSTWRVEVESSCEKAWNSLAWSSSLMPAPLSAMLISVTCTPSSSRWARLMRTVPCSVNLMALLSRLMRICVSARRSVSMMAGGWWDSPSSISSARPFCCARGRRVSATSAISSWQCTGSIDRVSLPASILATSRMSLISESRWRALARMVLSCLSWSDVRGPGSFISSAPVNPMMALSGVRSSCDILAMKADFMRLASASSRFFRAISRLMVSSSAAWCARRMFSSITWRSRACSSPLTCTACS